LPKIKLRSGRVTGIEALVRWEHPQRGLLLPGEFIPLAEEAGLIGPLCRWVLNAAVRQSQVWHRMGVRLPIEVNLSMRNLHDPQFPDTVARILETWGATPAALRLEIAEPATNEHLERASHTLGRLRTLGIGIGMDNFGTGGASLASLERLSLDEIKVDRSIVADMLVNQQSADAVRAAIELGHHLGLPVVAEGVSDEAIRDRLTSYGCDLAQGHYLARPMPAVELLGWLNREAQKSGQPEPGRGGQAEIGRVTAGRDNQEVTGSFV
jgi:EAL domain-containing protein (putative c-di-GMP-specific phosphodiesterase class I)